VKKFSCSPVEPDAGK